MYRRDLLGISVAAALVLVPGSALAQQKSIKDQLVGAWTLLLDDAIEKDGMHKPLYGPNPEGSFLFAPNGRYAVQVMRVNRPRFASNDRDKGTAEENKAAVQGLITHFGTYTVDEGGKTVTLHIEGSSYPNLEGIKQVWKVAEITDDVMTLDLPVAQSTSPTGGFAAVEVIWRKVK